MHISHRILSGLVFAAASASAQAEDVVRHGIPGSDFPIAAAVEVPAGRTTVYLSGKVPSVVNPEAPRDSLEAYGDTERQTVSVLTSIREQLEGLGLGMGDVVKMQVFLVGGPENDGRLDFAGFMKGYTQFFGKEAEQPRLPARSAFQIAGLANPGYRVEIEVIAVRP
ncbi:RidA family protein [Coralloluteibacterium stylophorae]|uniref:RidA family protein n=1 Tax=Coralloluteibacterium stylophorae TaxID=1776034 RepID=A0A8J7VVR1_9GAMM|nr:RidA family protein [Coralloluteibacterium stylophorae]MBS7456443.1 RidA family protein [Coralloluteibacterium stylophorae]